MSGADPASDGLASDGPAPETPADPAALGREIAALKRRLARTERNLRLLEDLRETNERLLGTLMRELDAERRKSEQLLLDILPRAVVERLGAGEGRIADRFEVAAILFTDFVGFSATAARLPAAEIVDRLGAVFAEFDRLAEAAGVEKVKTIGDAYMAAAGLPEARDDAAEALADLALAMVAENARLRAAGVSLWQIRVGLHAGPVVAGVIGRRRFLYDVWGDTVNVAARLESSSEPDRVHVSDAIARTLADRFRLTPREPRELRGIGWMATACLDGRRAG